MSHPGCYISIYGIGEAETTHDVAFDLEVYDEPDAALRRFLGCLMIGVMPRTGLEEALASLNDMLEFYKERPSVVARPQLAPPIVSATIVERKKRPDLVIP